MAYRDHLLDRIKIDLQFLVDSNDLSSYDYEQIVSKLPFPTPQRAMMPPLPQRPQQAQPEMRAPVPEMARVLHSYVQGQPDDLGLIQGEEVTLLERKNSDWWRGQKSDGSVGIFPSNVSTNFWFDFVNLH